MPSTGWTCLLVLGGLILVGAHHAPSVGAVAGGDGREGVEWQVRRSGPLEVGTDGWASLRREWREVTGLVSAELGQVRRMRRDASSRPALAAGGYPLCEPLAPRRRSYFSVTGYHMLILQRGHRPKLDAGVLDPWVPGPFGPRLSGPAGFSCDVQDGGAVVNHVNGRYDTRQPAQFGSGRYGQMLPFAILSNQGGPQMFLSQPVALCTAADTGTAWTPGAPLRGVELGFDSRPGWRVYLGAGQARLEGAHPTTRSMSVYASPEWRRWRRGSLAPSSRHTGLYASADYLWGRSGNSVTLYGYRGSATLPAGAARRGFYRLGAFANLCLPQTKLVAGYLTGSDTAAGGRSLAIPGYFVLAERLLTSRWAAYGRYDGLRRDLEAGGSQRITGPTLGASWWAHPQMRLTLEGQLLSTGTRPHDRRLVTGLSCVF